MNSTVYGSTTVPTHRKQQTKTLSLIESSINTTSGFFVSWLVWIYIIPIFWPHLRTTHAETFGVVFFFTAISVARGYVWRRFFERGFHLWVIKHFNGK